MSDKKKNLEEMIEFILEVTPQLSLIIKHATEEQVEHLYQEAHDKLNYALDIA